MTEQALHLDVDASGGFDSSTLIYYDLANLNFSGNPWPSLVVGPTPTATQALEITALAALPNGSKKILQYLVAPIALNLNFPASVTLDGTSPKFTAPTSTSFYVSGTDQGSVGSCTPTAPPVKGIGYTDSSVTLANFEQPGNPQGIQVSGPDLRGYYTGAGIPPPPTTPNIAQVTVSNNLSKVGELNKLVQTIEANADVVINHNATQADMPGPTVMTPTNPMTVVVNGDLVLSGWHGTGYGLLLITGDMTNMATPSFTYDPDAFWDGVILVIGKGWIYSYQGSYTNTQILGALLVAKTVDASGNPLSPLSPPPPLTSTSHQHWSPMVFSTAVAGSRPHKRP